MANNEWIDKYLREGWTFSFGSLLGAYGMMNQQKPKTIEEFCQDALKLYALSKKLTADSVGEQVGELQSDEIKRVKDWLKTIK